MSTLIKGGRVITAVDDYVADVYIDGEQIKAIAQNLPFKADRVIDATGKYVIPGGIDVHTHMELPFGGTFASDDFQTGTIAAAHGGTTTIIDFAVQYRGKSMREGFDTWLQKAEDKSAIDYGLHMILTELDDNTLPDMDQLVRREGVTSFKLFTAYPGVFMVDDATIFRAMKRSADNAALICMHAENGGVIDLLIKRNLSEGKTSPNYHALSRPATTEEEATHRVIKLSEMAGVPVYIVHVSSHRAMEQIRAARDQGLPTYGETCPQYLFLSYEDYSDGSFDGAKYICSPPIREQANQEHLWKALEVDDLQAVSTDHCPFCMKEGFKGLPKQKELGKGDFSKIPNGLPGVENRLHLLYQGGVLERGWSMNRFVQLVSTAPAKLMGLFPRKGTIAVGSDADVVVWDPNRKHTISAKTHFMRVDYNPYEGMTVDGSPAYVLSRGKVIFEGDQFTGKSGDGRFIKRNTYNLP
ncbi:dihydropyrimidinase [Candidatus Acetothermia bacterium]|nr:dihydropyrimidinase [Candidatus Acetothermia bacterium]